MVLSIAYSMLIPVDMTETVSLQNAGPCPAILSGLVALTYTYKKCISFHQQIVVVQSGTYQPAVVLVESMSPGNP